MEYSLHSKSIQSEDSFDLQSLKDKIKQLSKVEQLEIYKILKKADDKITENKNGIFINLSCMSQDTIKEIQAFVQYSLDNKVRLDKLEELSEELIRKSMCSDTEEKRYLKNPPSNNSNHNFTEDSGDLNQIVLDSKVNNTPSVSGQTRVISVNSIAPVATDSLNQDEEIDDISDEETLLKINDQPKTSHCDPTNLEQAIDLEADIDTIINTSSEMNSNNGIVSNNEQENDIDVDETEHGNDIELDLGQSRRKFQGNTGKILKKCKEYCRNNSYTGSNFISFCLEDDNDDKDISDSIFDNISDELQEDRIK